MNSHEQSALGKSDGIVSTLKLFIVFNHVADELNLQSMKKMSAFSS